MDRTSAVSDPPGARGARGSDHPDINGSHPPQPGRRRWSLQARQLHPFAWWIWAIAAAICVSRTRNPLGLVLIGSAVISVAVQRRRSGSGYEAIRVFIRFGVIVIFLRMFLAVIMGASFGATVLISLPSVNLPEWMVGVEIGGPIYLEVLINAFYEGLRLALILVCFGAVNALVSPYRLLRAMPQILHEAGVAVSIGLTLAPQLVLEASRVRQARRLRGRPTGFRGIRGTVMPVLEGSLERAADSASSMDGRGYGRAAAISDSRRRLAYLIGSLGLICAAISTYGIFAPSSPRFLGPTAAILAVAGVGGALWLAGSGSVRTVYRPDRWLGAEWMVSLAGIAAAVLFRFAAVGAEISPDTFPLGWPVLGAPSVVAALLLISPVITAPPVVEPLFAALTAMDANGTPVTASERNGEVST